MNHKLTIDDGDRTLTRDVKTSSDTNGIVGYKVTQTISGGAFGVTQSFSALGEFMGGKLGGYDLSTVTRDDYGNVTEISGPQTINYTRDSRHRVTGMNINKQNTVTYGFDAFDRVDTITTPRSQSVAFTHGNITDGAATNVTVDSVPVISNANRLGSAHETVLGAEGATSIDTTVSYGSKFTVSQDNTGTTTGTSQVTVEQDPDSGLLKKVTMPEGVDLNISRTSMGIPDQVSLADDTYLIGKSADRSYSITQVGGSQSTSVTFDLFGEISRLTHGQQTTSIERDDSGRLVEITTPGGETVKITYSSQNPAIPSLIVNGDKSIAYSNFNTQGLPEEVLLKLPHREVEMTITYHANGQAQQVQSTPKGGETTTVAYDEHGAVTSLKRPFENTITYARNQWGNVDTMTYEAEVYNIFQSRNNLRWAVLKNGADEVAVLDHYNWGGLKQLKRQGLADVDFLYDDATRLKQVLLAGSPLQTITYSDNEVSTVQFGSDLYTYAYDGDNRLEQVTGPNGVTGWTYESNGSDRVQTYTDPSGVQYTYGYDPKGNLTHIDIANGPTFEYDYDEMDQLIAVKSSGMEATFGGYQQGMPTSMTWGGGTPVKTFTISKTGDGRLDRIESSDGAFVLDLDWAQSTSGAWLVNRVEKTADGFGEVWAPTYTATDRLDGITITRSNGQIITETYSVGENRLLSGLTRNVDGTDVLGLSHTADPVAASKRQAIMTDNVSGSVWSAAYSGGPGDLESLSMDGVEKVALGYDAQRRITSVTHAVPGGSNLTYNAEYDLNNLRIRAEVPTGSGSTWTTKERVYAFQGSRVIAIGEITGGMIDWTHAIGWGPMGPVFIKGLTFSGNDYYLFTDHLGTPFGHHNPHTNTTYHTPTNPWGELLATHPDPVPHYAVQGQVATNGFTLPPDVTHPTSPLGLAGHLYDHHTGLVYMHNRHYHPRLGHFTTPDYRAPDIYDPSTYTEPYAYAAGNPLIFWDHNGLATVEIDHERLTLNVTVDEEDTVDTIIKELSSSFGKNNYIFREYNSGNSILRLWVKLELDIVRKDRNISVIDFSELLLLNGVAYSELPREPGFIPFTKSSQPEEKNILFKRIANEEIEKILHELTAEYYGNKRDYITNKIDDGLSMSKGILIAEINNHIRDSVIGFGFSKALDLFFETAQKIRYLRNTAKNDLSPRANKRTPSAAESAEIAAQQKLVEMTGKTPYAHYLGKHSPLISNQALLSRAVDGVDPWTGLVRRNNSGNIIYQNSTRFNSYVDMLESIEKAQRSFRASYKSISDIPYNGRSVTIDMLREIGVGYKKRSGDFRDGLRYVKVLFSREGDVISAYPLFNNPN